MPKIKDSVQCVNRLNRVIEQLYIAEQTLEELGLIAEMYRLAQVVEEIEHERDFLLTTEFPTVTANPRGSNNV